MIADDEDKNDQMAQSALQQPPRDHSFLSSTTTLTRSVADISAPLPNSQQPVVLLPEHLSQKGQTPFEPFPPLPFEKRSLLTTKRSTRRRATTVIQPLPERTNHPSIPSPPDLESEEHKNSLAPSYQYVTAELEQPSSNSAEEDTSTIQERQQSFGITARSTRWQ